MRSFPIPLDEIEEHINAIDGSGALELEHVIAMKRYGLSNMHVIMFSFKCKSLSCVCFKLCVQETILIVNLLCVDTL